MINKQGLIKNINNEGNPDILYFFLTKYLKEYTYIIGCTKDSVFHYRYELDNNSMICRFYFPNQNSLSNIEQNVPISLFKKQIDIINYFEEYIND
jgi:hypothetical protein